MISHEYQKRLTSTKVFYGFLRDLIANFKTGEKAISKEFQSKILLAVTQVNGCRYCSYLHTKHALEGGMSEEEVKGLLEGEIGKVGDEESVALMFAQHYADTRANPDATLVKKLYETYGNEKADDIIRTIQKIMTGNTYGIALDLLLERLKGKADPNSSFWAEFSTTFGVILFIPYLLIRRVLGLLKPKELIK